MQNLLHAALDPPDLSNLGIPETARSGSGASTKLHRNAEVGIGPGASLGTSLESADAFGKTNCHRLFARPYRGSGCCPPDSLQGGRSQPQPLEALTSLPEPWLHHSQALRRVWRTPLPPAKLLLPTLGAGAVVEPNTLRPAGVPAPAPTATVVSHHHHHFPPTRGAPRGA